MTPTNADPRPQGAAARRNIEAGALVCTVLPTYNERGNIAELVERLLAANRPPYLVLVVDDDSPDGTWQIVEALVQHQEAGEEHRQIGSVALCRRVGEKGLTSAIQRGIDEAIHTHGAAVVTWMDCDLSMPPEDVPALVQAIREHGADVAVGSRWIPGGADVAHGVMARSLSWIINHFAMLLLGRHVRDYTSGFIAARAEVLAVHPPSGRLWRVLHRPVGACPPQRIHPDRSSLRLRTPHGGRKQDRHIAAGLPEQGTQLRRHNLAALERRRVESEG